MIDAKYFCKSGYDLPLRRRRIPAFIGILRELSSFIADSLPLQSFIRRWVWIRRGVQGAYECGWETRRRADETSPRVTLTSILTQDERPNKQKTKLDPESLPLLFYGSTEQAAIQHSRRDSRPKNHDVGR